MNTLKPAILRIAVPTPLRQYFDYLAPVGCIPEQLQPGIRVRVPFQRRDLVGIFVGIAAEPDVSWNKLKSVAEILDKESIIPGDVLQLCFWAAEYYHFPVGEVLMSALPMLLRQGKIAMRSQETYWQLTELGRQIDPNTLKRVPKQLELLKLLAQQSYGISAKQLHTYGIKKTILLAASKKEWVRAVVVEGRQLEQEQVQVFTPLSLNAAQQEAVAAIKKMSREVTRVPLLLDGVTGSGKTEVYLQSMTEILEQQKQVLVLVPEIGLTPQTIQRFRERFSVPVVALHSGLSEKERLNAWLSAKSGEAKIIIGTRSAVFSPLQNLGLIIVDEEHDLSFKQQDGFRYNARDLAIMRAHFKKIPLVLGSATPSLETLCKVQQGRYQHLVLPKRAGDAKPPTFRVLDIRNAPLEEGLSKPLLNEIMQHLQNGNQVMLFLNRRGFAPILMCHRCGWMAKCKRCDARMTYHQNPARLHCHHCDSRKSILTRCEDCGEKELIAMGLGTERLERVLAKHFPDLSIVRIDRDSTQRKGKMEEMLTEIQRGDHQILIGTQMLAKGHHFPNVTLVAIVDMDSGFFSADFRAVERMGQLLLQVSGRAGRAEKPGTVIIQTHHPDHPLLQQLLQKNYREFALTLLQERAQASLPPFSFFALFRAEAHQADHAHDFLQQVKKIAGMARDNIHILGPIPAPMPRRAGRHRMQLLVQSKQRPLLQKFLKSLWAEVDKIAGKHRVRWSLDVDPLEMF